MTKRLGRVVGNHHRYLTTAATKAWVWRPQEEDREEEELSVDWVRGGWPSACRSPRERHNWIAFDDRITHPKTTLNRFNSKPNKIPTRTTTWTESRHYTRNSVNQLEPKNVGVLIFQTVCVCKSNSTKVKTSENERHRSASGAPNETKDTHGVHRSQFFGSSWMRYDVTKH
jgi:hypothetical protein